MRLDAARTWLVRSVCLVALAVNIYYLTWRALETFNAHALSLSIALYAAECYGLLTLVLHVVLTWDTRSLERRLGARDDQSVADVALPPPAGRTVDVFIPTYDECP